MQVTFISKKKLEKQRFLAKYNCFFNDLCVHFGPLLGQEDTRIEKEESRSK